MDNPHRQARMLRGGKTSEQVCVRELSNAMGDTSATEYLQRFKPQYAEHPSDGADDKIHLVKPGKAEQIAREGHV